MAVLGREGCMWTIVIVLFFKLSVMLHNFKIWKKKKKAQKTEFIIYEPPNK